MKPLMLHGHERPVTKIKFNREGDLLFSASKDKNPNVWYSLNGERLGTFNGHAGSVWCIDVNWSTTRFMSGSGDYTLRLWDCQTGKELSQTKTNSAVRTCAFSFCGNLAVYSTDKALGHLCEMYIVDTRTVDSSSSAQTDAICRTSIDGPRISSILWGLLDHTVITGHEDGVLQTWDFRLGKKINVEAGHSSMVNDMQLNRDGTMFITASKDTTAKLFDSDSLMHLKTYKTERPVNSATISPINDHVVLGGGQEAMVVTTTSSRQGKFDARFFHLVFEEEFARLKGHFGPINSLAFHPTGRSFASGGEDGYVRLQTFDQSYYDFNFEF